MRIKRHFTQAGKNAFKNIKTSKKRLRSTPPQHGARGPRPTRGEGRSVPTAAELGDVFVGTGARTPAADTDETVVLDWGQQCADQYEPQVIEDNGRLSLQLKEIDQVIEEEYRKTIKKVNTVV